MPIKSINGEALVVGTAGIEDGSVTDAKMQTTLFRRLIKSIGYATDAEVSLTDANLALRNSVVMVYDATSVSNLPSGMPTNRACYIITIGVGARITDTSPGLQMCVTVHKSANQSSYEAQAWYRTKYGASDSAWSKWVEVLATANGEVDWSSMPSGIVTTTKLADGTVTLDKIASSLINSLVVVNGYVSSSTDPIDANTVKRGTIYFVTSTGTCENLPAGAANAPMGFLVTLAGAPTSTGPNSMALQLFAKVINSTTDGWKTDVWYRSRYGASNNTWSDWEKVLNSNDVMEIASIPYGDVSMFRKVGVLGDSFASGTMYVDGVYVTQDYEQSWPKNMARQHGVEVVRYSQSGWGAYTWLHASESNTNGLGQFMRDVANGNVCDLYLICYGINDSSSSMEFGDKTGGINYLGSESDINESDYTQNANSYWGQMSRIIATIREYAPDSKIVLTTLARENFETRRMFTEAAKDIAEYWGVPCLYLYGDPFFQSDYWNNGMDGAHPTAPMYSGMAVAINRLLAKAMETDYAYFKTFTGIPSE